MIRIELEPGDRLVIGLKDTDGEFTVDYAASESNRLTVTANLPGNVKGDEGVIYQEEWDMPEDCMEEGKPVKGSFCHALNPLEIGKVCHRVKGHVGPHIDQTRGVWGHEPKPNDCGIRSPGHALRCCLPSGHPGEHKNGSLTWERFGAEPVKPAEKACGSMKPGTYTGTPVGGTTCVLAAGHPGDHEAVGTNWRNKRRDAYLTEEEAAKRDLEEGSLEPCNPGCTLDPTHEGPCEV